MQNLTILHVLIKLCDCHRNVIDSPYRKTVRLRRLNEEDNDLQSNFQKKAIASKILSKLTYKMINTAKISTDRF